MTKMRYMVCVLKGPRGLNKYTAKTYDKYALAEKYQHAIALIDATDRLTMSLDDKELVGVGTKIVYASANLTTYYIEDTFLTLQSEICHADRCD